jgi:hypothetical protein
MLGQREAFKKAGHFDWAFGDIQLVQGLAKGATGTPGAWQHMSV